MRLNAKSVFFATFALCGTATALPAQQQGEFAEYQVRTVLAMTPEQRTQVERIFFGRKDGSKGARTTEVINGKSCTSTTYWDTQARVEVTSSDCLLMKSTIPFTRLPPSPAKPIANCSTMLTENYVGSEMIDGLRVDKFDNDTAKGRSINYYAPDLGCLLVRGLHYSKAPDGRVRGTAFDEPVEIKLGIHGPELFVTPAFYREVRPSERRNALYRYFSGPLDSVSLTRANERDDKRYAEARRNPSH